MSGLRLSAVTVRHGHRTALDAVDLALPPGRSLGVVGRSGAGKSTLVRVALGLLRPASGTVAWDGRDLPGTRRRDRAAARAFRREVQYVAQDPAGSLDPRWRVHRLMEEPLRALRVPGDAAAHDRLIRDALALVDLPADLALRRPGEISGGQAQRVALARALVTGARVLVADEPFSSLDPALRDDLIATLDGLRAAGRLTLLLVSHDLSAVETLCDRVAVLDAGRVVEEGEVGPVLTAPASAEGRALLTARLPSPTDDTDAPRLPSILSHRTRNPL